MLENFGKLFYQNLERTRDQTTKCAFSVLEYITDENLRTKYLLDLEKVLVTCVVAEHNVALSRKAAEEAATRAVDEVTNLPDLHKFDEAYNETMDELKQDSDMREIISNAASVKSFREQLLAQIDPKSGYNNNDDDTEVMTTKETVNLIDPISKMIMTDPVRNKHCGHVYERLSVVKMIKASKRKGFRCPSMGCGYREPLKVTDLEDALDVKRQILINKK